MKTNKSLVLGMMVSAALLTTSCSEDFLNVEKPDGEPLEEYYNSKEHIEEAVIAAYDPIHWHDWGLDQYNAYNIDSEIMGDDFWVGGANYQDMMHWHMLGNFEATADNTLSTLWTIDYSGVKRCNDALRYLTWVELSPDYEASCEMQVRTLRVFYYNNLWHLFGNIPFYLENLTASTNYTAPQLKADEVYAQLITELEEVIDSKVLPVKWDDSNAGRVSQAMAILMYAEMVTYQNDTERFGKALSYLKEQVIGKYSLYPDFRGMWLTEGEWCSESIWEINYDQTQSERDWGSGLAVGGMVIPTLISPNDWHNGDGWAEDGNQDGWGFLPMRLRTLQMYDANDKRIAGTVWDVRGKEYTLRDADTHLWLFKYRPFDVNNANGTSSKNLNYANNYRVYRYAEALLYAAELSLRAANGSAADAKQYINEVRARAGITPLDNVTLDDVFTERHKEFVGEGKRYFDLVRAEFMTDAQVSSANKATGVLVPAQDEGVVGSQRTNAWKPTKKYIPIYQAELDSDPALVQNEDYFK